MITSVSSGKSSISRGPTSIPSGTSMWPSWPPDVRRSCASSARPARPCARAPRRRRRPAARGGCSRRSSSRRCAPRSARRPPRGAGPTTDSDGEKPARSALVESPHSSRTPSRPELGQARDVGRLAVDRRLVELVVAGDQDRAELGAERDGARVGDRVRHVDQLERERPELELVAGVDVVQLDVVAACARRASSAPSPSSAGRRRPAAGRRRRARAAPTAARRDGPRGRA